MFHSSGPPRVYMLWSKCVHICYDNMIEVQREAAGYGKGKEKENIHYIRD